jgi:hypothetical protein
MMPAVTVNQMAATTGAVLRNFFIGSGESKDGGVKTLSQGIGTGDQRGETVILLSASVSLPLVNSPKAARGQVAAARVLLNARGRSI